MSTSSTPTGYSLYDFLTRVLPGLTVMIPIAVAMLVGDSRLPVDNTISWIILAVIGLVIGELINIFRSALFRVPAPFKEVLYNYTRDKSILSRADRADLWAERHLPEFLQSRFFTGEVGRATIFDSNDEDFQSTFENHFDLKFRENSPHLIYSAFLSYMDTRMSTRTHRNYMIRIFSQNLVFASVLTGLAALYVAVQSLSPQTQAIAVISIFILFMVFSIAMFFSSVAYPLIDLLIIDYYVDGLDS